MGLVTLASSTLAVSTSSQFVPSSYGSSYGKFNALHAKKIHVSKPGLSLHSTAYLPRKLEIRGRRSLIICAAALGARCAEGQTQTVTRQSSTITIAPVQGKEKSPELDDGGTGFPPRDDDGGGGGGGGGGHNWSGGFFFFGLLAFFGLLKDQEEEGPYRETRRR